MTRTKSVLDLVADLRGVASRRWHTSTRAHPQDCLRCQLVEAADEIERLTTTLDAVEKAPSCTPRTSSGGSSRPATGISRRRPTVDALELLDGPESFCGHGWYRPGCCPECDLDYEADWGEE